MVSKAKNTESRIMKAFAECRDGLIRSIMKMRVKQEDVDDILQETFLRTMSANKKTQIASPQNYLFMVSRNLVYKELSRQSREIITEIDDAMAGVDDVATDIQLHYRKKFETLNDALLTLPENNRKAILLRKFYGLSHNEIAQKMNVSVSSVEKYISKGMKQCKQRLISKGYEIKGKPDVRKKEERSNTLGSEAKK